MLHVVKSSVWKEISGSSVHLVINILILHIFAVVVGLLMTCSVNRPKQPNSTIKTDIVGQKHSDNALIISDSLVIQLIQAYYDSYDSTTVVNILSKIHESSTKKNSLASTFLGQLYMRGDPFVEKDVKKAFLYLNDAIEAGNSQAVLEACHYHWNSGDFDSSLNLLYENQNSDGSIEITLSGIHLMGCPYYIENGVVVKEYLDSLVAKKYLLKASKLGLIDANLQLGIYYLNGIDSLFIQNDDSAKSYFSKVYYSKDAHFAVKDQVELILKSSKGKGWKIWIAQ